MALVSAVLFGITTPLATELLTGGNRLLIAGLLYSGNGVGLTLPMASSRTAGTRETMPTERVYLFP